MLYICRSIRGIRPTKNDKILTLNPQILRKYAAFGGIITYRAAPSKIGTVTIKNANITIIVWKIEANESSRVPKNREKMELLPLLHKANGPKYTKFYVILFLAIGSQQPVSLVPVSSIVSEINRFK